VGRFDDRLTHTLPTYRDLWKILREGGFGGKDPDRLAQAARIPVKRGPLPALGAGQASLTWVGHATYLVRFKGLTVLTDPVLGKSIPGNIKRRVPLGLTWEELPAIDAVVLSHDHYDHLDATTVKRLGDRVRFFVPLGTKAWFEGKGLTDVVELDWWQSAEFKGARFTFVPAHHWCRRTPWDTNKRLWGGWVVDPASGPKVYFAGDTGYGHWFEAIGKTHPGIDTAILPIGAYAPRWFMKPVHMDPEEAVRAMRDVGAKRLASMHWGTFVLTQEPLDEPLALVRAAWTTAELPREDLLDLAIGESRVVG
jgi:L-ascorbate metabolism protein UlaG (beta-lactamase superfamily)